MIFVLDSQGRVCEYDGYEYPEQGEDTPENRALREKAMAEFMERARKDREAHERKD